MERCIILISHQEEVGGDIMAKKLFTTSQVSKITGASRHEAVHIPFYYAPPFLDELREWLKSRLSSRGGRPTIRGAEIVRKVRLSEESWHKLNLISKSWSQSGTSVSPAQVASSILEQVISVNTAKKVTAQEKGPRGALSSGSKSD